MKDVCAKCGAKVLPDVAVMTNVDNLTAVPVAAVAHLNPDALIFKNPRTYPILAQVCSECGYCEFYVKNPQGLAATIEKGQKD